MLFSSKSKKGGDTPKPDTWQDFSHRAICAVEQFCLDHHQVMLVELLNIAAPIRQQAAVALNHPDPRGTSVFGEFMPSGKTGLETEQAFNLQRIELLADNLTLKRDSGTVFTINKIPVPNSKQVMLEAIVPFPMLCQQGRIELTAEQFEAIYQYLCDNLKTQAVPKAELINSFKDPISRAAKHLSTFRLCLLNQSASVYYGNIVSSQLEYTRNDIYFNFTHFAFMEQCFCQLRQWDKAIDSKEAFLSTAAKLLYMLVHRMPYRRGTSSIAEWVIKGLAKSKGIEMPEKLSKSGDDWQWRALTQPNIEEFAAWFVHRMGCISSFITNNSI